MVNYRDSPQDKCDCASTISSRRREGRVRALPTRYVQYVQGPEMPAVPCRLFLLRRLAGLWRKWRRNVQQGGSENVRTDPSAVTAIVAYTLGIVDCRATPAV